MARYYRRRKRAFTKRQAKAIKAIATDIPETNVWAFNIHTAPGTPTGGSYLPNGSVIPGINPNPLPTVAGRYMINIFANMPRINQSTLPPSQKVVGDSIISVGFSAQFIANLFGNRNWRFRLTVLSTSIRDFADPASPVSIIDNDYDWINREGFGAKTYSGWNPDSIHVLKQKVYHFKTDQSTGTSHQMKLWCPITGKKTFDNQPNVTEEAITTYLGGKNYYLIVEWYTPNGTTTTYTPTGTDALVVSGVGKLYFKDP